MKKKVFGMLLLGALLLGAVGCGVKYPELKDDAIAFDMGEFLDESDGGAHGTIEYNGRVYLPYGTIKNALKEKDIKECIGYILHNENSSSIVDPEDKNTRVYTLAGDPDENYLMVYDISTTLMNQPDFWRAIDTKGHETDIPNFMQSLDYGYWE